ncbi:DUF317 domain-containing protein [Streptomyces physcomitrii]|uniref:DUF317 domain-containing protein n=1 Tax=Streptomyces physcomitrii TaxID=2724184 RepID=UPI000A9EADFD
MFAISPCARLWTRFSPGSEGRGQGTWTIGANRVPFGSQAWEIVFDATTPAELLHDVHTELLDLYLQDRSSDHNPLFEDSTAAHEVYTPLLTRGWSHHIKTNGIQIFLPPEGLGSVHHRYATTGSDGPTWRACGGHQNDPHWRTRFSFAAPTTLVAAFTASLVSTEPVHRTAKDIPLRTRRHLYTALAVAKQPPRYPTPAPPPTTPGDSRTR